MKYNEAQEQAIKHNKGPMMVLAGPGSGKTMVIINRTRTLIEKYGVDPRKILVITFTKAAATEMKERFLSLMEGNELYKSVNFGTFHAIFFSILRHAFKIDYSNIISDESKQALIKEIVSKYDIETEDEKELLEEIESEISLVKGEMIELSNYYSQSCPNEKFRKIYGKYNESLELHRLIDFDDMIVRCYKLFRDYPQILAKWQQQYEHILIDEFQDINLLQYKIMQMLAKPQDNIFIVGDDDQSIYRFRGAKPEIMLGFTKDYPECKTCMLDINYRCSGHIVEAASKIIKNNKERYDKDIRTINELGPCVDIVQFKSVKEESTELIEKIKYYLSKGVAYSDIAVLYRTNSQPRSLVEKLMEYNVPFAIKDGLPSVYNHWIAKTIIAYMNAARQCFGCDKSGHSATRIIDRATFLQIANKPNRYISRAVMSTPYIDFESLKSEFENKEWMVERLEDFEYDLSKVAKMNVYSAINYIRKGMGYDEYIEDYAATKKINIEELYEVLDEFHENCKEIETLEELYEHIDRYNEELAKNLSNSKKDKDAITMMTFHGAKGLEFQVVFIIDACEGLTPHKKSVKEADIEEERRMFYVAVTRAKKHLHIYYPDERYSKELQPSRFVGEILIDRESLVEGAVIIHKVYGKGIIKKHAENRLTVKFEKIAIQKILDVDFCVSNKLIQLAD